MTLWERVFINNRKKGVLTIELSILMPAIMAVLILIIYMCFYLHDKCVFERACYVSAVKNCHIKDENIMKQNTCVNIENILNDNLFSKWEYELNFIAEHEYLKVHINGNMKMSNNLVFNFFNSVLFDLDDEIIVQREFEPDYLREN